MDLGPGHIVLNAVPALRKRGTAAPLFSAYVYCGHGRQSQRLLSSCINGRLKTVRPVLSGRCPVCLSVLSVTLVYCGPTVGWIKMPLGKEVGLGPCNIVLDGHPALPLRKKGHSSLPTFGPMYCGQTAGWIKMPLSMAVGLGPGLIVLDGDPAASTSPQRGTPPVFGPRLLWPNGWMDQDAT